MVTLCLQLIQNIGYVPVLYNYNPIACLIPNSFYNSFLKMFIGYTLFDCHLYIQQYFFVIFLIE